LIQKVNIGIIESINLIDKVEIEIVKIEEAELDEMWSYVGKKSCKRWLWHAIDHNTGVILAYTFGSRKDKVFKELKKLLKPFGIQKFYSDDWGAYERNLEKHSHEVGKTNTQKIERKHLTLRTRIKRLARKTICFSKTLLMHDLVIGLFINVHEFGLVFKT
jgi:insertion element IS1 protein InsB